MLSKKEFKMLIINGVLMFLVVVIFVFIYYNMNTQNNKHSNSMTDNNKDAQEHESKTTMANLEPKIQKDTKVVFEIKDQLDLEIKTETYQGDDWAGYSKEEFNNMYPDYTINVFGEDEVRLTRVIERDVTPNYILTEQDNKLAILLDINGTRMFYKNLDIGKHVFSDKLNKELLKGILLTNNQKELILENEDELYKILQEYDE